MEYFVSHAAECVNNKHHVIDNWTKYEFYSLNVEFI